MDGTQGKETSLLTQLRQRCRKRDAALQKGYREERARGRGGRVKSRKQAIAIGLSKARKKGKKVPKKASKRKSAKKTSRKSSKSSKSSKKSSKRKSSKR